MCYTQHSWQILIALNVLYILAHVSSNFELDFCARWDQTLAMLSKKDESKFHIHVIHNELPMADENITDIQPLRLVPNKWIVQSYKMIRIMNFYVIQTVARQLTALSHYFLMKWEELYFIANDSWNVSLYALYWIGACLSNIENDYYFIYATSANSIYLKNWGEVYFVFFFFFFASTLAVDFTL